MADTPFKEITEQARHLLSQVSGASRAVAAAEHTATHLQNVERWAQHEFQAQRQAHEHRLSELERRVAKLEKSQNALAAAGAPSSCPKVTDALDLVSTTPAYYERWEQLLSEVNSQCDIFSQVPSVLEIYAGAGKTGAFLQDKVQHYVGVEPSEVLRSAARRQIRDVRFSFVDLAGAEALPFKAELVLLLAEKQRWSIHDTDRLLELAASKLAEKGRIVLAIPYSFRDLRDAGWQLSAKLESLGLLPLREVLISGPSECMLIGRVSDVERT